MSAHDALNALKDRSVVAAVRLHEQAQLLMDERDEALRERDLYRAALERIAASESGVWGQIAHAALHPEREAA